MLDRTAIFRSAHSPVGRASPNVIPSTLCEARGSGSDDQGPAWKTPRAIAENAAGAILERSSNGSRVRPSITPICAPSICVIDGNPRVSQLRTARRCSLRSIPRAARNRLPAERLQRNTLPRLSTMRHAQNRENRNSRNRYLRKTHRPMRNNIQSRG